MSNNAAFYYLAEGYQTGGKSMMGRQSAGEGFLKGFARNAGVDMFYCYGPDLEQFENFRRDIAEGAGGDPPCSFISFDDFPKLSEIGCLYIPGPNFSGDAWVRRTHGNRSYSICGVTHTTATEKIMDSFGALLIDPVQSWDAVVCTSTAVKKTVERVTGAYNDYLEERLGVRSSLTVQLPVIPLGVDCAQFAPPEAAEQRAEWRKSLGLGDDDIAVLYVGRLSFTAKAHPLPMFLALDEVARRTGKKICLIMAGWFDPPAAENLWKKDSKRYCRSLNVVFLDGRKDEVRRQIWHAADIFTSLSDNIQETFGLTPIEAMAAGLPVVVTDWDGYRDTVRHGVDGFRVPVMMPKPGLGEDLAVRFANKVDSYGKYCGTVSQMTSVDIGAVIAAFMKLVQEPELRRKMGSAGRQRALEVYDWSVVVKQYQQLWGELAQRRAVDKETGAKKPGSASIPLRLDPFSLFKEYPTACITGKSNVMLAAGRIKGWMDHISASVMNNYLQADGRLLLRPEEQAVILEFLQQNGKSTVAELAGLLPPGREIAANRTIGWLAKVGAIALRGAD